MGHRWGPARVNIASTMLDHIGFFVADYERSRTFYKQALAPLGYGLVQEVISSSGKRACGFGEGGKPDFWIAGDDKTKPDVHVAFQAPSREAVDLFHAVALRTVVRTTACRASERIIIRTTMRPLCSIPTTTTSRPHAIARVRQLIR